MKDAPTTKPYITRNGTNYGVPLDTSVVTIVEKGVKVNYVLQQGKYIAGGDVAPVVAQKTITENGTYNAKTENLDGYSNVIVNVEPKLQGKEAVENGRVSADAGYQGLNYVDVNVPTYNGDDKTVKYVIDTGSIIRSVEMSADQKFLALIQNKISPQTEEIIIPSTLLGVDTSNGAAFTGAGLENVKAIRSYYDSYFDLTKFPSLKEVRYSGNVADMGFFMSNSVETVFIDDTVTDVRLPSQGGEGAAIKKIIFGDNVSKITTDPNWRGAYIKNLVIPSSVKTIEGDGFNSSSNLENVIIGSGVEKIPCFNQHLKNIIISEGVKSIVEYAFLNNEELTYLSIPDSVTTIGTSAFGSCQKLETLIIGNGVTSIGDNMARQCPNLKTVIIKGNWGSIPQTTTIFNGDHSLSAILYDGQIFTSASEFYNYVWPGSGEYSS